MAETSLTLSNTRNILNVELEAGWQQVDTLEGELIFTWDRYINAFFSVFAGADLHFVNKDLSLVGQWHSDYGLGGGLQLRF